ALLDRGHFDEAAEALEGWTGDASPAVAIARARLLTNQGEPARALSELSAVGDEVARAGDAELGAFWSLHVARARLRAADYSGGEKRAAEAGQRIGAGAEGPANAESRPTETEGPANAESRPTETEGPANAESRPTETEGPANAESRPTETEGPANAESRPTET